MIISSIQPWIFHLHYFFILLCFCSISFTQFACRFVAHFFLVRTKLCVGANWQTVSKTNGRKIVHHESSNLCECASALDTVFLVNCIGRTNHEHWQREWLDFRMSSKMCAKYLDWQHARQHVEWSSNEDVLKCVYFVALLCHYFDVCVAEVISVWCAFLL